MKTLNKMITLSILCLTAISLVEMGEAASLASPKPIGQSGRRIELAEASSEAQPTILTTQTEKEKAKEKEVDPQQPAK